MFENNYKNAFDSIKPDEEVKEKVLDKIISIENKQKKGKNPANIWRIGFAVSTAAAIILSIVFVPKRSNDVTVNTNTITASSSYNDIYSVFGKMKKEQAKYNIKYFFSGTDDAEIMEDIEYVDESAANGAAGAGSTNASSQTSDKGNDFSETTVQVEGVKESDIVKTDGEYIYYLDGEYLSVYKAADENTVLVGKTHLKQNDGAQYSEMYLNGDRLIILENQFYQYLKYDSQTYTSIIVYDVSNPENLKKLGVCSQKGSYTNSRMIGNYVYLFSNCYINIHDTKKSQPETFVPTVVCDDTETAVPAESIYCYEAGTYEPQYSVICAYDTTDCTMKSTVSLLGGADEIYCSGENIITANIQYNSLDAEQSQGSYVSNKTLVSRLTIDDGKIEYKASGEIDGTLDNQFFIDEHEGNFRFVTTVDYTTVTQTRFANTSESISTYQNESYAKLTILDGELKQIGTIKNIAEGERVYSVRFMGEIAYFVTFRQTDPLFSADLSDPYNPKIIGELKIPGFSEYLYPYGDGLLLGFGMDANEKTGATNCLKLSMFDISDASNVTEHDITKLEGYIHSPALYNHKAMLVSNEKNLIGFASFKASGSDTSKYMLYSYSQQGFETLIQIDVSWATEKYTYSAEGIRGIFIKDSLYIISANGIRCYDLNGFTCIREIDS